MESLVGQSVATSASPHMDGKRPCYTRRPGLYTLFQALEVIAQIAAIEVLVYGKGGGTQFPLRGLSRVLPIQDVC